MEQLELKSLIKVCQTEELSPEERHLVELAIEATNRSYSPYSHFKVGAAVRLENGALEMSNVNVADEMINMIRIEKMFTTQVKLMKTAEEMDQQANNLLRLS